MNNCPKCNIPASDDTKFCPECGIPLSRPTKLNYQQPTQPISQEGSVPVDTVPQENIPQYPVYGAQQSCVTQSEPVPQGNQQAPNPGYQPYKGTQASVTPHQQGGPVDGQPQYGQPQYSQPQNGYAPGPNSVHQGVGTYPPVSPTADIENNKVMAVLSYFGVLCLIPVFGAKDSPFARFHANQGISLAILGIGFPIVKAILKSIFYAISFSLGLTMSTILGILGGAVSLFVFVLSIMGIVYACKGEMKELPLIGKIKILK